MRQTAEVIYIDGSKRGVFQFVDLEELHRNSFRERVYTPIPSTIRINEEKNQTTAQCFIETYEMQPIKTFYDQHKFIAQVIPK